MQVHQHFESVIACPSHCLLQEGQLALNEGLARSNRESPITNWDANMVEAVRERKVFSAHLHFLIKARLVAHPAAAIAAKSASE